MTARISAAIALATMLFVGFPQFDNLLADDTPTTWGTLKNSEESDPASKPATMMVWEEVFSITINGTELPAGGHETNLKGLSVSHFNGQPFLVIMGVPARFGATAGYKMEFVGSQGDRITLSSGRVTRDRNTPNVLDVWFSEPFTGSLAQIDLLGNGLEERYYGRLTMWVGEARMAESNARRRGH